MVFRPDMKVGSGILWAAAVLVFGLWVTALCGWLVWQDEQQQDARDREELAGQIVQSVERRTKSLEALLRGLRAYMSASAANDVAGGLRYLQAVEPPAHLGQIGTVHILDEMDGVNRPEGVAQIQVRALKAGTEQRQLQVLPSGSPFAQALRKSYNTQGLTLTPVAPDAENSDRSQQYALLMSFSMDSPVRRWLMIHIDLHVLMTRVHEDLASLHALELYDAHLPSPTNRVFAWREDPRRSPVFVQKTVLLGDRTLQLAVDGKLHPRKWPASSLVLVIGVATSSCLALLTALLLRIRRDAQLRLARLFEHSRDGIVVIDAQGRLCELNAAVGEVLGYAPVELIGQALHDLVLPMERGRLDTVLHDLRQKGSLKGTWSFRTRGGESVPVTVSVSQLSPQRFLAVVRDLRPRLRAAAVLKTSQQKLDAIIKAAQLGTFEWQLNSGAVVWNDRHAELFGMTLEAFDGRYQGFSERVHPEDLPGVERAVEDSRRRKVPYAHEYRVRRADGSWRWISGRGEFIYNDTTGEAETMLGVVMDIDAQRRAEMSLLARQTELAAVFENEPDCLKITDRECRLLSMNAAGLAMLEVSTVEALKQQDLLDFVLPEYREDFLACLQSALQGAAASTEFRLKGQRGTERWVDMRAVPMRTPAGEVQAVLSITRDVTEKRETERALAETAQRYKLLFQTNPVPMWMYDLRSLRFLAVNDSAVRAYGFSQDEFLGMSIEKIRPPEDVPNLRLAVEHIRRRGVTEKENGLWRHRRKDGHEFWVEVQAHRIVMDDADAVIVLAQDVTLRMEAERKVELLLRRLHDQRRELQQTIDSIVDAIITIDQKGFIERFNPAAEQMFGYLAPEVIGKKVNILMPERFATQHDGYLERHVRTGEKKVIGLGRELEARHKSGRVFPIRLSVAELPPSSDGARRFIGGCHDLTEEHKREEQALRSQKMDALGKLTSGIAHDFNNILGIISGYTEMLEAVSGENEKIARYVAQIGVATTRATRLTQKLLNFSSERQRAPQRTQLETLLHGLEDMLREAVSKSVHLIMQLDMPIWPVCVDAQDLENALINLAVNARHAMNGGGELRIVVRNVQVQALAPEHVGVPEGNYVCIEVRDSGCGMTEAVKARIFEPFFTTKGELGTGLGLAQVYGFVHRAGGQVRVDSAPGRGSAFFLYVPRMAGDVDAPVSRALPAAAGARVGHERVLLVDDEGALRQVTAELLAHAGYVVRTACSLDEARLCLRDEGFDVLLSDVVMPGGSGIELAIEASLAYPEMKILLMSGFVDSASVPDAAHAAWADRILRKPVAAAELLTRLRQLLDDAPRSGESALENA